MLSIENKALWNKFDHCRAELERQFDNVNYDNNSGLDEAELKEKVQMFLKSNSTISHLLQKAHIYRIIVTEGSIAIQPEDWFADKLCHANILKDLQNKWVNEMELKHIPFETAWRDKCRESGYLSSRLDLGHLAPGWATLLNHGLNGLLEQARKEKEHYGEKLTNEQSEFYEALEIVYNATIVFSNRLADLALSMIDSNNEYADSLRTVASSLRHVPANPPRDLHEAFQFVYLIHQLVEMEGQRVRSMGGFDKMFYPYYSEDIKSGRLSREQAKELIKFFWTKFFAHTKGVDNGKNFYFGGQYPDGTLVANELSKLALEAYEELATTDPKLSVRISKNTPDWLLRQVSNIIRKGLTSFVLINEEVAIQSLIKMGKTIEEARSYLLIGCYEPVAEELEIACTTAASINFSKIIEMVLHNGQDPMTKRQIGLPTGNPIDFSDYESLFEAYIKQLDFTIDNVTNYIRAIERHWPEANPSPFLAGSFMDCIKKGKDIGQGGPKYNNSGIMGVALANAADSLMAIKRIVFEEKRCTLAEMASITESNFKGHDELLIYARNRVPKWGNANNEVDSIACEIASHFTTKINGKPNSRGGYFQASLFSVMDRFTYGKKTGALPDGRLSGEYLAGGINSTTSMDKKGITAHIRSVTRIDYTNLPNGSVFELYLHPSAVQGEEGLEAFMGLIKTYFATGGFGIQFNIFDTETLKDAQLHPERYATLQVRVCGWNVYFVSLNEYEQKQYIESNKHLFN